MKQINLLPKSEQKELELEVVLGRIWTFWIWVVVSFLLFFALAFGVKLYLRHLIAQASDEIAENQSVLNSADYKQLQDQITQLNTSVSQVNNLRNQHYNWSEALVALADLTPPTVQLNHLNLNRTTGEIDISGQAKTRDDVINLWSAIIKSDYFHGIDFPLANLEKDNLPDFNFTFFANTDKLKNP